MLRDYNKIEENIADSVSAIDNNDLKTAKKELIKLLNQMRGE